MLRSNPSDVCQDTRVMLEQNCGLNKGRRGRGFISGGIKKRRISWLPRVEFIIRVTVKARHEKIRRYSVSISQSYLHVTWMADRILMPPLVRTEIKRLGREKILFKLATRDKSVRARSLERGLSCFFKSNVLVFTHGKLNYFLVKSRILKTAKVRIIF